MILQAFYAFLKEIKVIYYYLLQLVGWLYAFLFGFDKRARGETSKFS